MKMDRWRKMEEFFDVYGQRRIRQELLKGSSELTVKASNLEGKLLGQKMK